MGLHQSEKLLQSKGNQQQSETAAHQREKSFAHCLSDKGLEMEMATHSSILAWKIPRTKEQATRHRVAQE